MRLNGNDNRAKVTGLSPREGISGVKITIRGENLGKSSDDLIALTICGVDCLMFAEWKSSSKIICRSGKCEGLGDVIITTKSGGVGTCTVQFKGLMDIISPTKESSVWVDEDDYFTFPNNRSRAKSSPSVFSSDPLGLCSDAQEGSLKTTLRENLIREFFPDSCGDDKNYGNTFSPYFIPAWYLLENQRGATFQELVQGLEHLKTKVNEKTPPSSSLSPVALFKPNVLDIIECLDAMKGVSLALKKDKQDGGFDLAWKMEELIKKSLDEAHKIFDSILARKDQADSTRNALNVLQRYRFLFNLPSSIERNIQKNDYEVVINSYSRAKSLFADTQVRVFKKVYDEVEQRIIKFRSLLHEKLIKSCCNQDLRNIEDLKKLIQYLTHLEVPGNPGWESIVRIKENLIKSLKDCKEKHLNLAQSPKVVTEDLNNSLEDDEFDTRIQAPQSVHFIEELTLIFEKTFSDLVKLGNAYINSDLFTKETEKQLLIKEQIFNVEMVQKPIELYINLVRSVLMPSSLRNVPDIKPWPIETDESFLIWLPHCLSICSNFYCELSRNELPNHSLHSVQQLISDLRVHSLVCLFNQAAEEVKLLYNKEDWKNISDDTLGTRTLLPSLFENKVIEILQLVRKTILQTTSADEVDIFTKINVQGQMKQLAQNLLQAFLFALEKTFKSELSSSDTSATRHYDEEDRTLIVICNCSFTTSQVIPRLYENFEKYNYPDMSLVLKVVQGKYRDLENQLFSQYIEKKCDTVLSLVKPAMYAAAKEVYTSLTKSTDVSFYVKELIMTIIEVQSKIFLIAPSLVRRVVTGVIELAIEEIARLFECVSDRLSEAGNVQAQIDLSALEIVFMDADTYQNSKSEKLFHVTRSRLKSVTNSADQKLMSKILARFRSSMQLQISCFKWSNDQNVIII